MSKRIQSSEQNQLTFVYHHFLLAPKISAKTPFKTQNSGLTLKAKSVPHPKICNWDDTLGLELNCDQTRMAFRFLSISKTPTKTQNLVLGLKTKKFSHPKNT